MPINIIKLTTLATSLALSTAILSGCGGSSDSSSDNPKFTKLSFKPAGTYLHGAFDKSAAEITAFHPASKRGFVVNAENKRIDILDMSDITKPVLFKSIGLTLFGDTVNSVAVSGNIVAAAVQSNDKTSAGTLVLLDANKAELISSVKVGALPDMVTFTPDGKTILVANEGEPNDDYSIDPEGSISIVNVAKPKTPTVKTANFKAFNANATDLKIKGVRISGKNASVAQDLEPEYIAISNDSDTAYISLQENNAIAVLDINSAKITDIKPLGYKDHSQVGNELDISDKDGKSQLATWPVMGLYQPDGIASFRRNGKNYLITANEGDGREYTYQDQNGKKRLAFTDETKVGKINLDTTALTDAKCGNQLCSDDKAMGRLKIARDLGDDNGDGLYEQVFSFGARSFSIWDTSDMSNPVYDSGSSLAKLVLEKHPNNFNASNNDNAADNRSDNKGVEPEGVVIGEVQGKLIAFVGLERISSIVAYDISNPTKPLQMGYINTRTFNDATMKQVQDGKIAANADGDLGPEGMTFIPADESPNGKPLLFVGYEVSGTSRIFELDFS